jgi:hypothetical protein
MISEGQRGVLTKQGYRVIGSHSAVKMCRWTKRFSLSVSLSFFIFYFFIFFFFHFHFHFLFHFLFLFSFSLSFSFLNFKYFPYPPHKYVTRKRRLLQTHILWYRESSMYGNNTVISVC